MIRLAENDVLEKRTGYKIEDSWSRVFVYRHDKAFSMYAILPSTMLYARGDIGDDSSAFRPEWRTEESIFEEYEKVERV